MNRIFDFSVYWVQGVRGWITWFVAISGSL